MSIRIGLFTIVVDDYDEAIDHYTKALGFELVEDLDQGDKRWVVVRPPGAETGIVLAEASDDQQRATIGNQTGGRVGFFLYTNDFVREYERMRRADVTFLETPRHEPYGTVAVFQDKYGNKWDLLEPAGMQ